jgi:hypothetical protein
MWRKTCGWLVSSKTGEKMINQSIFFRFCHLPSQIYSKQKFKKGGSWFPTFQ